MSVSEYIQERQPDFSYHRRSNLIVEQVKLLYKHASALLMGNTIVSLTMAIVVWGYVENHLVISWLSAIYILSVLRILLINRYAKAKDREGNILRWAVYFVASSGVSGVLWGMASVFFIVPENPFISAFVVILICAMVASSVTSLSSYAPAHFAFATPTMLIMTYRFAIEEGTVYTYLAIMAFFFLIVNIILSRNIVRTIQDSINLRFDNLELVRALTIQKERAESAQEEAVQANVTKSKFLAATSHDLRQPLHALGLFIGSLDETNLENNQKTLVGKIKDSVSALGNLFDGLLDISKLDAGVIDINKQDFYLENIWKKLEPEFMPLAKNKGLVFNIEAKSCAVQSDPLHLERILRNLLTNAINYTAEGCVTISCKRKNGMVEISVTDTGPGIPEEEQDRIFSEFHQLHNPEHDRSKGLGLGLAIVSRLCSLLEHTLGMESVYGQGATFRITVPEGNAENIIDDDIHLKQSPWALENITVLVIDDEHAILEAMHSVLESWGCKVLVAGSIEQAEAEIQAQQSEPDIIISDYRLRDNVTGIDALQSLQRSIGQTIPGILITGDTAGAVLQKAKNSGYHLLHKPVKPAQLRMVVNQLLASKS